MLVLRDIPTAALRSHNGTGFGNREGWQPVPDRWLVSLSALLGLLAVAAGAFGAHALAADPHAAGLVETASRYQMWHALALLLLGITGQRVPVAVGAWLVGVLLFCGSLYALALGAPSGVAWLAPIGGLLLMAGWAALAVSGWRRRTA
jgi:uncharacterized membrane protein YgdD (TMEM256/DUF423 family)